MNGPIKPWPSRGGPGQDSTNSKDKISTEDSAASASLTRAFDPRTITEVVRPIFLMPVTFTICFPIQEPIINKKKRALWANDTNDLNLQNSIPIEHLMKRSEYQIHSQGYQ